MTPTLISSEAFPAGAEAKEKLRPDRTAKALVWPVKVLRELSFSLGSGLHRKQC